MLTAQYLRTQLKRVRDCVFMGLLISHLTGCGYTVVGGTDRSIPKGYALFIVPFSNQAREPDVERLMTMALRQTLLQNQVLRSAADETASHRLHGIIRRFSAIPLSFDERDNVLQYRLEVDVRVRLMEAPTKSPILEQDISAATEYLVSRVAANRVREDVVARQAALALLAQQFADKCLALLTVVLF